MPQDSSPLGGKGLPRTAATKALKSFAGQLDSSSDDDHNISKAPQTPKKVSVTRSYSRRGGGRTGKQNQESARPSSLSRTATKLNRKRRPSSPVTPTYTSSDDGPLTPLASSPCTPRVTPPTKSTYVVPQASSSSPTKKAQLADIWDISKCETYVWVLVDESGKLVNQETTDGERKGMWWPGKVKSLDVPLRVTLYGEITSRAAGTITVPSPSPQNIQPMLTSLQKLRFDSSDFITSPRIEDSGGVRASPKKKLKTDNSAIKQRWQAATDKMMNAYEDDNDGLPDVALMFSTSISHTTGGSARKKVGNGRKKQSTSVSDTEDFNEVPDTNDGWTPEEQDELIQVPGELVYARVKPSFTFYYPARITNYIPPENKKQKPKYVVEFMDGTTRAITRNLFFTPDDDGFGTCQLGPFKSSVQDHSDGEESDDESMALVKGDRPSSPEPFEPIPTPEEFTKLTVHEQFAFVKPVLKAIINEEYGPARRRHDHFIKGGNARNTVTSDVGLRGEIAVCDVKQLGTCLRRWALRGESRTRRMDAEDGNAEVVSVDDFTPAVPSSPVVAPPSSFSTVDVPNISSCPPPPRQRGSEAYESLSAIERITYVQDVLQPEAILQILLWRSGNRRSLTLLEPKEEERLHDVALSLSQKLHWVFSIARLRDLKSGSLKHNGEEESVAGPNVSTGTGRPKRSCTSIRRG